MSTPFLQFYVADYLADTQHLTTEQHGAYLLILFAMWRANGAELEADDSKLARIARLTVTRWNRIKGDVMALLTIESGRVTQKRLRAELQKAEEKSQKRAAAGRNGGNAKALKNNKQAVAIARDLPRHSSEPESEPEKKKKEPPSLRSGADAPEASVPSTPRKTALPPLFPGPPELAWAVKHWTDKGRPDLAARVQDEADQFRDYHGGKTRTLALDWPATWRTWARKALTMTRAPPGSRQPDKPEWKPINLDSL
jgi:uncharacterized protein YdaU (DUF1376 family)